MNFICLSQETNNHVRQVSSHRSVIYYDLSFQLSNGSFIALIEILIFALFIIAGTTKFSPYYPSSPSSCFSPSTSSIGLIDDQNDGTSDVCRCARAFNLAPTQRRISPFLCTLRAPGDNPRSFSSNLLANYAAIALSVTHASILVDTSCSAKAAHAFDLRAPISLFRVRGREPLEVRGGTWIISERSASERRPCAMCGGEGNSKVVQLQLHNTPEYRPQTGA